MAKSKEELEALAKELETVSKKLSALTEEELNEVSGGRQDIHMMAARYDIPEIRVAEAEPAAPATIKPKKHATGFNPHPTGFDPEPKHATGFDPETKHATGFDPGTIGLAEDNK